MPTRPRLSDRRARTPLPPGPAEPSAEARAQAAPRSPARAKGRQGFASMDKDRRRRIASLGGQTAHALGRAHQFTREEALCAGSKGGTVTSRNREHMAQIGRKGGIARGRRHADRRRPTSPRLPTRQPDTTPLTD